MKHYLIYQIRNKLNGMIYIGQHQTENIDDDYMGSGPRIQYAIKKYGLENFEKTILFECASAKEMNAKEAEIVNEDFIARDDVYNIVVGGSGQGFQYANKTGLNNKGKTISSALRKKLIDGQLKDRKIHPERYDRRKENNPMFGRKHSASTKKLIAESHKGDKNPMKIRMWIRNPQTREFKVWLKTEPIPIGWEKGKYQPRKK